MEIETRDFGRVKVQEENVVHFCSPIYGFEGMRDFVLLCRREGSHLVWLQSLEDPQLCFILLDPAMVDGQYRPALPEEVRQLLGEGEYMLWLITVVAPDFQDSTVNMKSPVVVNPANCRAAQVILEEDYPIRQPLGARGKGRV